MIKDVIAHQRAGRTEQAEQGVAELGRLSQQVAELLGLIKQQARRVCGPGSKAAGRGPPWPVMGQAEA